MYERRLQCDRYCGHTTGFGDRDGGATVTIDGVGGGDGGSGSDDDSTARLFFFFRGHHQCVRCAFTVRRPLSTRIVRLSFITNNNNNNKQCYAFVRGRVSLENRSTAFRSDLSLIIPTNKISLFQIRDCFGFGPTPSIVLLAGENVRVVRVRTQFANSLPVVSVRRTVYRTVDHDGQSFSLTRSRFAEIRVDVVVVPDNKIPFAVRNSAVYEREWDGRGGK